MGYIIRMPYKVVISAIIALVLFSAEGRAATDDEFSRERKQDVYLLGQVINGKQFDFKTQSGVVPLYMDSVALGGIGFGYHFGGPWAFRFETLFGNTNVHGAGVAAGTSRSVWMNSFMAIFDWLPVSRPVSPFVSAGFGMQYIEAQLSNTGVPVAYWDPWWGYTSTVSYATHSETDFVSQLGVGIRWDVTQGFFLKVSYDSSFINYVNAGWTNQAKYGLTIGASY